MYRARGRLRSGRTWVKTFNDVREFYEIMRDKASVVSAIDENGKILFEVKRKKNQPHEQGSFYLSEKTPPYMRIFIKNHF